MRRRRLTRVIYVLTFGSYCCCCCCCCTPIAAKQSRTDQNRRQLSTLRLSNAAEYPHHECSSSGSNAFRSATHSMFWGQSTWKLCDIFLRRRLSSFSLLHEILFWQLLSRRWSGSVQLSGHLTKKWRVRLLCVRTNLLQFYPHLRLKPLTVDR